MRVYATELADPKDELVGWGLKIVVSEYERAGHCVEYKALAGPHPGGHRPDVWLVSLPYAGDAWRIRDFFDRIACEPLAREKRSGKTIYILGGHAVANTSPFLDIFDFVFVGEADDQAFHIGRAGADVGALRSIPGMDWHGAGEVWFQIARDLSKRGVYSNTSDTEGVRDTDYLEVARGCKQACRFCEIGWAYGYTERPREEAERFAREKVQAGGDPAALVLSAPDTDGVSWYADAVADGEFNPRWRSTRIIPYLKARSAGRKGRRQKIRFGVEGVTERLRRLAGKFMTDEQIELAVRKAADEGYLMFRLFIIAGVPTETAEDRRHLQQLLDIFKKVKGARAWQSTDVKITGLSPQPFTPWQRCGIRGALDALDEYRRRKPLEERRDRYWKNVFIDAQATEADVVKQMWPGELIPYLEVRGVGPVEGRARVRWQQVKAWADMAGLPYEDRLFDDKPLPAPLPWDRVRHPREDRIKNGERIAWKQIARERGEPADVADLLPY